MQFASITRVNSNFDFNSKQRIRPTTNTHPYRTKILLFIHKIVLYINLGSYYYLHAATDQTLPNPFLMNDNPAPSSAPGDLVYSSSGDGNVLDHSNHLQKQWAHHNGHRLHERIQPLHRQPIQRHQMHRRVHLMI